MRRTILPLAILFATLALPALATDLLFPEVTPVEISDLGASGHMTESIVGTLLNTGLDVADPEIVAARLPDLRRAQVVIAVAGLARPGSRFDVVHRADGSTLAAVASLLLQRTAMAEERECLAYFGKPYSDYMQRTRRFIPFLY